MAGKTNAGFCQKPDRDEPRMRCGYPLPCPHHTLEILPGSVVAIPAAATATRGQINRVHDIAAALSPRLRSHGRSQGRASAARKEG